MITNRLGLVNTCILFGNWLALNVGSKAWHSICVRQIKQSPPETTRIEIARYKDSRAQLEWEGDDTLPVVRPDQCNRPSRRRLFK